MQHKGVCNSHLIAPCRKPPGQPLPGSAQGYNDIHGFYRSRVEHVFGVLWGFSLVRNKWTGGEQRFFIHLKLLLNLYTFAMRRKYKYEPVGPWGLIPEGCSSGASQALPDPSQPTQVGESDGMEEPKQAPFPTFSAMEISLHMHRTAAMNLMQSQQRNAILFARAHSINQPHGCSLTHK